MKWIVILILIALNLPAGLAQTNRIHPADSIYSHKTDSIDFSTPPKYPARDSNSLRIRERYKWRDSLQLDATKPMEALIDSGAKVDVVSLKPGKVKGWKDKNWSNDVSVDQTVDEVTSKDYDALVLPGGVINSDQLRMNKNAVNFVKGFFEGAK